MTQKLSVQAMPQLGSQLFINRGDTPEMARAWLRDMSDTGLKLVRLFMFWDLVEPREGEWDYSVFDAIFDEAESLGLGIIPTMYTFTTPGWMRRIRSSQSVDDIIDPMVREKGFYYLKKSVERYRSHPALHSWILWNEAGISLKPDARYTEDYRRYLKSYHGSIERYNQLGYQHYASFDEVEIHCDDDGVDFWAPHVERLDWLRFNRWMLMNAISEIRDAIRALDAEHPIHVNPHLTLSNHVDTGQDIFEEGRLMDFLGCSAHPVWHFTRFDRSHWPQALAMAAIQMRSASRGDRFWVSELQAGPAVDSGYVGDTPTAEDLSLWLWTGISTGAEAIVYWCFNDRNDGSEAGEWRLFGPAGQTTKRSKASLEVSKTLEKHKDWFGGSKALKPKAHLLYSMASRTFAAMQEEVDMDDPRNQHHWDDAACGAFALVDSCHEELGFVDELGLAQLNPSESPLLIATNTVNIERPETITAMKDFVEAGGTLVVDGAFGLKDAEGWIARDRKEEIEALIGAERVDHTCFQGTRSIALSAESSLFDSSDAKAFDAWFIREDWSPKDGVKTLARWEDGDPAILEHALGQGRVITIGTRFFQRYFAQREEAMVSVFQALLGTVFADQGELRGLLSLELLAERDEKTSRHLVRHGVLQSPKGALHFIMNAGPATERRLSSSSSVRMEMLSPTSADKSCALASSRSWTEKSLSAGESMVLPLASMETVILGVTELR